MKYLIATLALALCACGGTNDNDLPGGWNIVHCSVTNGATVEASVTYKTLTPQGASEQTATLKVGETKALTVAGYGTTPLYLVVSILYRTEPKVITYPATNEGVYIADRSNG